MTDEAASDAPTPADPETKYVQIDVGGSDAPLGVFIYNAENKDAVSAVRKIVQQARPGALIALTQAEFDAVTDGRDFRKLLP